ncbi:DUF4913 domain-containing protein [Acaricomes phytoseiuli]|uniref:DUF4913 domain-containing protein n=1 Tax=Acaricomes phytoseiuli TaxID=291968 RepID=UPI0014616794|nr:DUF4913 domain-containing protein [Acaricomes phytoseiuli]
MKEFDEELAEFVTTVLIPVWEDRHRDSSWCQKWWLHTEVVNRIQDLCDGWQNIGNDEDNITVNTWYRYYLDHHMPIITAKEHGPLASCTAQHHSEQSSNQWSTFTKPVTLG